MIRTFGQDLIYSNAIEEEDINFRNLLDLNKTLVSIDEMTSFPTLGGLMLHTGFQAVSTEQASFKLGKKWIEFTLSLG